MSWEHSGYGLATMFGGVAVDTQKHAATKPNVGVSPEPECSAERVSSVIAAAGCMLSQ